MLMAMILGLAVVGSPRAEFFIGCYTSPDGSQGIYRASMDLQTGALSSPVLAAKAESPSFLIRHSAGFLYAAHESIGFAGAYAIGPGSRLTLLNRQVTRGSSPCHVSLDRAGRWLLVANYGGSGACFPIRKDGSLGSASAVIRNAGSGPVRGRQDGSHVHSMNVSPPPVDGAKVYACDLGTDEVLIHALDQRGDLARIGTAKLAPGTGPRHLAFHPGGRILYVGGELANTVTVLAIDSRTGGLRPLQTLSTLPRGGAGKVAEVALHPGGRWLYVSNRGHDSIAVFEVRADGRLKRVAIEKAGVREPRHFALHPSGRWMVVAGQSSNDLVSFAVESKTGRLEPTGSRTRLSRPTCIVWR